MIDHKLMNLQLEFVKNRRKIFCSWWRPEYTGLHKFRPCVTGIMCMMLTKKLHSLFFSGESLVSDKTVCKAITMNVYLMHLIHFICLNSSDEDKRSDKIAFGLEIQAFNLVGSSSGEFAEFQCLNSASEIQTSKNKRSRLIWWLSPEDHFELKSTSVELFKNCKIKELNGRFEKKLPSDISRAL